MTMSLPIFPDIPEGITVDNAIYQILISIAMEEIGLSHVINAEGEKIQYIIGTLPGSAPAVPPTIDQVIEVNESVKETLQQVAFNQMLLSSKMADALKAYLKNKKDGSDPIDPPKPPEVIITVKFNGNNPLIEEGSRYGPDYTITPPEYESQAVWSTSDPTIATADKNGMIYAHKPGIVVITLAVGDVFDTLTLTVTPSAAKGLPLTKGEGPYAPRIDPDDERNNFSLVVSVNATPTEGSGPLFKLLESGAIKLVDILDTDDLSGIRVRPEDASLNHLFWVENDKSGAPAVKYDYYPTDIDLWLAEKEGPTNIYVYLILSKPGYNDTRIKAHLLYNDSIFAGGGTGGVSQ